MFAFVAMATSFLYKVEFLNNSERGPIIPVKIGEVPPSGLGGRYCRLKTEGRMGGCQDILTYDRHPMTTM